MKKMLVNFENHILSRSEMKEVFGRAEATADCAGGTSVTCSGTYCGARDTAGCICSSPGGYFDFKACPIQ